MQTLQTDSNMSENRFIDLETRIAFLEDTVNALNELVYRQQEQLVNYKNHIQNLTKHMTQMQTDIGKNTAEDEIPPHY